MGTGVRSWGLCVFLVVLLVVSLSTYAGAAEISFYLDHTTYSENNGRTTYCYVLEVSDPGILTVGSSFLHVTGMDGVLSQGDALLWRNAGITRTSASWVYDYRARSYRTRFAYFDVIADSSVTEPGPVDYEVDASEGKVGTVQGPVAKTSPELYPVSGTTYVDLDGDGEFSEGDQVLSGVTVELAGTPTGGGSHSDADVTNSGFTDENGNYLANCRFREVPPGGYEVSAPASVTGPDGQKLVLVTAAGLAFDIIDAPVDGLDFGYVPEPTYTVSGTVFIDYNRDGLYDDTTEDRLADVTVQLLDDSGEVIAEATSSADPILGDGGEYLGNYLFEGVAVGTYTVHAPIIAGELDELEITTVPDKAATVIDAPATGIDFGYVDPDYELPAEADVLAYVFFDVNRNGEFDDFEMGFEDVGVTLSDSGDTTLLQTDAAGLADFGSREGGDYSIAVTDGGGYGLLEYWETTTPASYDFTIDADTESPLVFYFGYYPEPCEIVKAMHKCEITGDNHTIGFWKHNVRRALADCSKGVQVPKADLLEYLAAVEALDADAGYWDEPFDLGGNPLWKALWYLHPSLSDNCPLQKLDRQLLAAELNVVSGYSSSMPQLEAAMLWWAEYVHNEDQGQAGSMAWFLDQWNNLGNMSCGGGCSPGYGDDDDGRRGGGRDGHNRRGGGRHGHRPRR